MSNFSKFSTRIIFSLVALTIPLIGPTTLQAQGVLEEIIVTAQRREQSLQEVPISIETFSGAEITRRGYRDMQELVNFSPTVNIDPDILRSSITIRGFGAASADALTIEQSSPTFVDGIHYGRTSQIKLAFLDLQAVEILKGPQPVYFGQNAIAGAFNLTTRKPTDEWEGFADLEYSNNNTQKLEMAVGGPITDTLGIRVAGSFERSDGYMRDIITDDKFPNFKNYGGRVILQWNPTDAFQATMKFETSDQNKGAQGNHICQVPGQTAEVDRGYFAPQAVLLNPPRGTGWDIEHQPLGECYASNWGIVPSGNLPPDPAVYETGRTILVNINGLADVNGLADSIPRPSSADGFREDRKPYDFRSREGIKPYNLYLDLSYSFDNGVTLNSLTGYDYYYREYLRDNRGTPFYANFQNREEDQYSMSQELRLTSPTGGTFEWMFGGYYQDVDYDIFSDSLRPNTRAPRRYNEGYEDASWKSVFGNVTFNFYNDKASIDLGARYHNSKKETHIRGYVAEWIMSDGVVIPYNTRINEFNNNTALYPIYNGDEVIGMTDLHEISTVEGPHTGSTSKTQFNPQIVLRYRPSENHSVYAKYAESFKAAGFNTGQATIPSEDAYSFGPEYAKNYEIGAKGNLFDGRARYGITAFFQKTTDLQISAAQANPDNALLNFSNAGAQRVQGVEFNLDWLPMDNWAVGFSGAFLDGVMLDYIGDCTDAEFEAAAQTGCDLTDNTIDRSGTQSANTPDWKFVMNSRYTHAMSNGYDVSFNAEGYFADGRITDGNGFSQVTKYNRHGDVSASIVVGPQDGVWSLTAFTRNLLEASESYNPEFDFGTDGGIRSPVMYRSNFMSYGMKFRYNYD
jgi:iron complex outermembrane recepter protein